MEREGVDEEAPGEGDGDREATSEAGAPSRVPTTYFVAASVAAVVLAVLAVVAVVLFVQADSQREEAEAGAEQLSGERQEAAVIAGRLTEALLSYDHQNLEAQRQAVLELSAEPFTGQYEEFFPSIGDLLGEVQGLAVATVKDVFVGEVAEGTATVIVVADRRVTSTGGTRDETDVYVRVDLARIEGEWKVVGVTNLNLALTSTGLEGELPGP